MPMRVRRKESSTCASSAPPGTERLLTRKPSNRVRSKLRLARRWLGRFSGGHVSLLLDSFEEPGPLVSDQGSTILAADSPKPGEQTGYNGGTYDLAEPNTAWDAYQDYGHNHWHNSLFWGEDLHDLSITGPGLIYGRGLSSRRQSHRAATIRLSAEQAGVGNKAIALKNCRNVLFRDFSILKGGHFGFLLQESTTSPSTTSRSIPTAMASTSTAARMCASPTAP